MVKASEAGLQTNRGIEAKESWTATTTEDEASGQQEAKGPTQKFRSRHSSANVRGSLASAGFALYCSCHVPIFKTAKRKLVKTSAPSDHRS